MEIEPHHCGGLGAERHVLAEDIRERVEGSCS
jgi:hypothetical protein